MSKKPELAELLRTLSRYEWDHSYYHFIADLDLPNDSYAMGMWIAYGNLTQQLRVINPNMLEKLLHVILERKDGTRVTSGSPQSN